jgi:DNA ligase-1
MKAVAQSSGRSEKQVLQDTEDTGDLGIVAQNSCGRQAKLFQPPPLSVPGVFNQLKTVATMKGRDVSILHQSYYLLIDQPFYERFFFQSMSKKLDKVVAMYNACKPIEARYLIRSLLGKLRIGLAEQTVLQVNTIITVNLNILCEAEHLYCMHRMLRRCRVNAAPLFF